MFLSEALNRTKKKTQADTESRVEHLLDEIWINERQGDQGLE